MIPISRDARTVQMETPLGCLQRISQLFVCPRCGHLSHPFPANRALISRGLPRVSLRETAISPFLANV